MKNGMIEDRFGDKRWYKNNKLHREDGPAIEWANGGECWYIEDQRHREDGPAQIDGDGTKVWILHDEFHREDGPVVEYADGRKAWYLHGDLVYSEYSDYTCDFELSDLMKKQIIKYKLERM